MEEKRSPHISAAPSFCLKELHGRERRDEPVSVSVPLPEGFSCNTRWIVKDENGLEWQCQTQILATWPSLTAQWIQVAFLASLPPHATKVFHLEVDGLKSTSGENKTSQRLTFGAEKLLSLSSEPSNQRPIQLNLRAARSSGKTLTAIADPPVVDVAGEIFDRVRIAGKLGTRRPILFTSTATYYHQGSYLRLDLTLHNPRRAEHRGGYWDLGDPHSENFSHVFVSVDWEGGATPKVIWESELGGEPDEALTNGWKLEQHSSGGENWRSRTHVDASGEVPPWQRGYSVTWDDQEKKGLRATPTVAISNEQQSISATMVDFWEKFPSALGVENAHGNSRIELAILPNTGAAHELQPGEQLTKTIWLQWDRDRENPLALNWVHQPIVAYPLRQSVVAADCLEWLADESTAEIGRKQLAACHTFLEEMLSGETSFFCKREAIDEYGWRNFGDCWADHEEAYSDDPRPVISHYNNQYDLLNGVLRQFLATGDQRWWRLARPLANHIMDIDIYHTDQDRPVYNHGLFWHTSHYRDAGTSSHRSFSRRMTGEKNRVDGGGQSNEHNYTTGLLLFYLLTGDLRAKQTVVSAADWVIAMDEGATSLFAPLSGAPTGNASSTRQGTFHGPGRGVGNSINALLDAWRLTHETRFLKKCDELIYRCFHPDEDFDALELLDAENRWSYTVGLQALMRYEKFIGEAVVKTKTVDYVRVCLSRYGAWMSENEVLFMDNREQLEFPTETWPAQDLRKATTMMLAAVHAPTADRVSRNEQGKEMFHAAFKQLMSYPSRHCTRPATLVLQQLPLAEYALNRQFPTKNQTMVVDKWEPREPFIRQKQHLQDSLRSPTALLAMLARATRPTLWKYTLPHTALGRWCRRVRFW